MTSGSRLRRVTAPVVLLLAVVIGMTACSVDGTPVREGRAVGSNEGDVDTDDFERLLLECDIVPPAAIAEAVGGGVADPGFFGANCRWVVHAPGGVVDVTFTWFEWGDYNHEKDTAKRLGYTTENIQVRSQAGFTARDPKRPTMCGATAKSPSRGTYTWWVEPKTRGAADPCAAPIKLLEMILTGAN